MYVQHTMKYIKCYNGLKMSTIFSNKIWSHRSTISYVLDCECLTKMRERKKETEREEEERVRLCEKYENKSSFGMLSLYC